MKQHITIEDLNQLSSKAKGRLVNWWNPDFDDTQVMMYLPDQDDRVVSGNWDQEIKVFNMDTLEVVLMQKLKNYEGAMYPLLSIGQMVEFLDEHGAFKENHLWRGENGWVFGSFDDFSSERTIELCDALWTAVKKILEANDK